MMDAASELKIGIIGGTGIGQLLKDAGERKDRRYDPTRESNFLRSRWNSTNG